MRKASSTSQMPPLLDRRKLAKTPTFIRRTIFASYKASFAAQSPGSTLAADKSVSYRPLIFTDIYDRNADAASPYESASPNKSLNISMSCNKLVSALRNLSNLNPTRQRWKQQPNLFNIRHTQVMSESLSVTAVSLTPGSKSHAECFFRADVNPLGAEPNSHKQLNKTCCLHMFPRQRSHQRLVLAPVYKRCATRQAPRRYVVDPFHISKNLVNTSLIPRILEIPDVPFPCGNVSGATKKHAKHSTWFDARRVMRRGSSKESASPPGKGEDPQLEQKRRAMKVRELCGEIARTLLNTRDMARRQSRLLRPKEKQQEEKPKMIDEVVMTRVPPVVRERGNAFSIRISIKKKTG